MIILGNINSLKYIQSKSRHVSQQSGSNSFSCRSSFFMSLRDALEIRTRTIYIHPGRRWHKHYLNA